MFCRTKGHRTWADYTTIEMLSISMLIVISTFALDFIHSDREYLQDGWTLMKHGRSLNVAQGKTLANKLVRAGRSMNAAVYFVTQNAGDGETRISRTTSA